MGGGRLPKTPPKWKQFYQCSSFLSGDGRFPGPFRNERDGLLKFIQYPGAGDDACQRLQIEIARSFRSLVFSDKT